MRYIAGFLLFVIGLIIQWAWATHFSIGSISPQVLLILTVAVASRSGAIGGQIFGFSWGIFLDVLSIHIFGAHALGLSLVGYFTGMLRRQMDIASASSQILFVAILTPAYFLFYAIAGHVFEGQFLWAGWKAFFICPFYNAIISPFGFALAKRFIRTQ